MANLLKTLFLLGILSVILIFIGNLFGGEAGMWTAFLFALVMNGGAYFFSDKIALSMSGAKPLSKHENPELYKIVEELAHKMHIPMPKLYMTPTAQANAFATGRDPNHASVAVTRGIMEVLSREELKAVLAHELGHVKNRDVLIATVAAVLASAISFVANMSLFAPRDNDENPGAGIMGLVIALLVPIGASIVQMAVSRQREFGADYTGAKTIGDGQPLASALRKIHETTRRSPLRDVNPALSSLYIDNPLGGAGGRMINLFSTHPPVEERIKRLNKI